MKKLNALLLASIFGIAILTTGMSWAAPLPGAVYDLSRDFSPTNNPAGPWSYGAMPTLAGPFSLFTVRGLNYNTDTRVPEEYW